MRGLTSAERAFIRSQDVSCSARCAGDGEPFTAEQDAMAHRLEGRGLLRWEACPSGCGQHVTPTVDARTLLFVYDTMIALYGGT